MRQTAPATGSRSRPTLPRLSATLLVLTLSLSAIGCNTQQSIVSPYYDAIHPTTRDHHAIMALAEAEAEVATATTEQLALMP